MGGSGLAGICWMGGTYIDSEAWRAGTRGLESRDKRPGEKLQRGIGGEDETSRGKSRAGMTDMHTRER